jgi:hypothetical protein
VVRGVAVEKLAHFDFAKIASRQEALQTISRPHVDIFYHPIFDLSRGNRLFQQPRDFSTSLTKSASSRVFNSVLFFSDTLPQLCSPVVFRSSAAPQFSVCFFPVQPTGSVRVTSSTRCCPPDISPIIPDHDDVFRTPRNWGRRVTHSVNPVTAPQDHCCDQASPHRHYRFPAVLFRDGTTLGNQSGHAS